MGPVALGSHRPQTEGWAPVRELIGAHAEQVEPGRDGGATTMEIQQVGQDPAGPTVEDGTTSRTHACENPQPHGAEMVVHGHAQAMHTEAGNLSDKEVVALGNIKSFSAGLLKKLAPPLLKEIEGVRGVRAGQDPFTPRRTTRSVCATGTRKTKATAAETVLLKTLGISSDDLAVSDDSLGQLRAIAAIFGKIMPTNLSCDMEQTARLSA